MWTLGASEMVFTDRRFYKTVVAAVALLTAGILASGAAQAEVLDVTIVENGATLISWTQSSTPVVDNSDAGVFTAVETSIGEVNFLNISEDGGGLNFGAHLVVSTGQMYSGSEASPVFGVGSFSGFDAHNGEADTTVTFSAAVPELSTWAMMMTGFAGLGFVGYRSSRKSATLAV
jgi:hypothetical protein